MSSYGFCTGMHGHIHTCMRMSHTCMHKLCAKHTLIKNAELNLRPSTVGDWLGFVSSLGKRQLCQKEKSRVKTYMELAHLFHC